MYNWTYRIIQKVFVVFMRLVKFTRGSLRRQYGVCNLRQRSTSRAALLTRTEVWLRLL